VPGDSFDKLPPLSGPSAVGPLQPGAVLLAAAPEGHALLAVRDTGAFRTAAFTADSTWLWVLSAADPWGPDRHARFWRGLVLWAARRDDAATGRDDLVVLTDRLRYLLAEPDRAPAVRATVYARAADDVPRLRLTTPDGRTRDLVLAPVRKGEWETELQADTPGTWRLRAEISSSAVPSSVQSEVRNPKSEILAAADTDFVVLEQDFEMTTLLADHDALRRTAEGGGGTFRTIDGLGDLLKELAQAQMQVFEPVERRWPLASGRVFLALVVALLSADWLLRRGLLS